MSDRQRLIAPGAAASVGLWLTAHGGLSLLGGFRSLERFPQPPTPAWRLWTEVGLGLALLVSGLWAYKLAGGFRVDSKALVPGPEDQPLDRRRKIANLLAVAGAALGIVYVLVELSR